MRGCPAAPPRTRGPAVPNERPRLRADIAQGIVAPDPMTYGSQAAAASQVFEQQRDLALRDRSRLELSRVEAALRSIDDGTYGTCTNCGNPIGAERLGAIPWAPTCIDLARKLRRGGPSLD